MKYVTIIIALTALCFLACKNETKVDNSPTEKTDINSVYIKTVPIENVVEASQMNALGIIYSESEAKPSFKTGGIIAKTYVKEGDMVRQGQLLATLLMDEINAQVQQAEEGLIKTERDMNRLKKLLADSVATLEQYQNTKTAYEVAKRNVEIARFNKNYSEVRSPISGKVIKHIMRTGEVVGPGTPIFAIMGVGNKDWIIKAGLTDRDWARVNNDDKVEIQLDAYPGQTFEGTVKNKTSVGGNTSGTFDVEIRFINQPKNLAAGLTAKIIISTKSKDSFVVIPLESLVRSNGNKGTAFTVENGKAKKLELTIAKLLGDKVSISGGLEGVNEIVTTGAMYLEEGDKVIVQ